MRTLLAILFLLPFYTAFAQSDTTGTISGVVINAQEEVVNRARVAVYGPEGMAAFVSTNERGKFMTEPIATGTYEVHVIARGFKRSVITKVPVTAKKNTPVPVKIFERRSPSDTIYVYSNYDIPVREKTP